MKNRLWLAPAALLLALLGVVLVLSCSTPTTVSGGVPDAGLSPLSTDTAAPTPSPQPAVPTRPSSEAAASTVAPTPADPEALAIPAAGETTPVYGYRVINSFPHDPGAFTQGLVYTDGILYEGTGYWGLSSLRKVELETGQILQSVPLPSPGTFGEGITVWEDRIVQLNWRAPVAGEPNVGFVYDKVGFTLLYTFTYSTEGWGITHDGTRLIMSDGSATLRFWDPDSLTEIGQVQVHDENGPVARLNELEYIDGLVYANVWLTDRIAIIDPETGQVAAWIDLTGLLDEPTGSEDVLNGIAYDVQGDRLFVTGKWWPRLYEIELLSGWFLPLVFKSSQ